MTVGRRGFIGGLAALIAAPAIVRASSIMPVRSFSDISVENPYREFVITAITQCKTTFLKMDDIEWTPRDLPRVGDTVRIVAPEKFEIQPFGWRTHAPNREAIHGLVMSTSDHRNLSGLGDSLNRGDALNA